MILRFELRLLGTEVLAVEAVSDSEQKKEDESAEMHFGFAGYESEVERLMPSRLDEDSEDEDS